MSDAIALQNLQVENSKALELRIQELEATVSKWRERALRDQLTGCMRREALIEVIESRRSMGWLSEQCTLVVLDVDHFKKVNDTWGHPVGDAVLSHLGRLLREARLPEGSLVARTGGEEFALIIPTRKGEVESAVENLREQIASTAITVSGARVKSLYITVSMGLVEWNTDKALIEAVARADELLYRAKREGRNRIAA